MCPSRTPLLLVLSLWWLPGIACSAITGLDEISIVDESSQASSGSGNTHVGGQGGTGASDGSGGQGGEGGGTCTPALETCGNGVDENCNGLDDDQDPAACALVNGTTSGGTPSLVVRYHIDEGSTGTTPAELQDANAEVSPPVNLALDFANDAMTWNAANGHRSLLWAERGTAGMARAEISGTKVYSMLDGHNALTIEAVVKVSRAAITDSFITWIATAGNAGRLALSVGASTQTASLTWNNSLLGVWSVDFSARDRCVLHAVVDATNPTVANRLRLYVDGEELTELDGQGTPPTMDDALVLGTQSFLVLGNRLLSSGSNQSFEGRLFYTALYASALTPVEVKNNALVLLASDDSPSPP